ncbi:uncharacterized protein A4U43_C07F23460 [Asparagus officinalis]|uniref:DUF599 domain-containing protein n=2 Tax=Asparagus officinalis TaxID=4686 RepID=A0A5P1EEA9_ASPOF|nr:uncharacterized protein A4U43_C07F23460 [Asparagus officinalis]
MSSTLLASTAITLCSLVGMLMTQSSPSSSLTLVVNQKHFSLKSFLILSCFLVAFLMNIQSVRFYNHASILINARRSPLLTPEYVADVVNRASYFWSVGLRAFYFSFPLFLWIFGAVPMFLCCVGLVCMLRLLDVMFHGMVAAEEADEFVGDGRGERALSSSQMPS